MTPSSLALHLSPLPAETGGTTPWNLHPGWFGLLLLVVPALLWAGLAWKRAFDEDPHRLRRAGRRELQRLLTRVRAAGGTPRPADLAAWCQATAHTWNVRVAAPTGDEVNRSMRALEGDSAIRVSWAQLWRDTESSLYAAGGAASPEWTRAASAAAGQTRIPPRQHWFPDRARHWLPSLAVALYVVCSVVGNAERAQAADAALPALDPKDAVALTAAQDRAGQVLRGDWNSWTAHYDIAAQQIVQGNVDYAVAHLAAAFVQHPASAIVRDNLRWSLQQTGTMDPTLRRLLYGAWFQRYPALLSPADWQRLGLAAALLAAGGAGALVLSLYAGRRRELRRGGRWGIVSGLVLLAVCIMAWNAWGDFARPSAAMLVAGIGLSPAPTELVKEQETTPVNAGTLVVPQSTFLGWKQVRVVGVPHVGAGWLRAGVAMPLYAN